MEEGLSQACHESTFVSNSIDNLHKEWSILMEAKQKVGKRS